MMKFFLLVFISPLLCQSLFAAIQKAPPYAPSEAIVIYKSVESPQAAVRAFKSVKTYRALSGTKKGAIALVRGNLPTKELIEKLKSDLNVVAVNASVDLAAPGTSIYSSLPGGDYLPKAGDIFFDAGVLGYSSLYSQPSSFSFLALNFSMVAKRVCTPIVPRAQMMARAVKLRPCVQIFLQYLN